MRHICSIYLEKFHLLILIGCLLFSPGCSKRSDEYSLRRIAILEDARTLGGKEISSFFKHHSVLIRGRAAIAAGRIGDREIIPELVGLLSDDRERVRIETAFALGQLKDSSAAEPLVEYFLSQTGLEEKTYALEALGKIGGAEALKFLRKQLEAGEEEIIPPAIMSLTRAKDRTSLADIAAYMTDSSAAIRQAAAYACSRMADSTVMLQLLSALEDSDAMVRKYSAEALGRIGLSEIAPRLIPLFNDSNISVRVQAIRAAGKCRSREPVEELVKLAGDSDYRIFREAIDALGNLKAELAADALAKMVRTGSAEKIPYLIRALAKIEGRRFIPFLDTYSDHPSAAIRRSAGESLAYIKGPRTLALAEDMLMDSDPTVRTAVIVGLTAHGSTAGSLLTEALNDSDWAVRTAAAEGLASIRYGSSFDILKECYIKRLNKTEADETRAMMEALYQLNRDKALPLIRRALNSPRFAVVAKAKELLKEMGESPPPNPTPTDDKYPPEFGEPLGYPNISLITSKGRIEIELFGDEAPMVVANMLKLIRNRFYQRMVFHRVVPDFIVQGGDPRGDGWGGPGYTIKDQINSRKFLKGTMGLPISAPDIGGCQFFICLSPQPHLDGNYTAFGQVVKGFETLLNLAEGDSIEEITLSVKEESVVKYREL